VSSLPNPNHLKGILNITNKKYTGVKKMKSLAKTAFNLHAKVVKVFKAMPDGGVMRFYQSLSQRAAKIAPRILTISMPTPVSAFAHVKRH
jgi:hypothetical protein